MKYLKTPKSLEEEEKIKRRPREKAREKKDTQNRCIGQCDRKVVVKDGTPSIYCSGCERYIKSL